MEVVAAWSQAEVDYTKETTRQARPNACPAPL